MIDTDVLVTTVTRGSTFDRLPANFDDPDRTDLDRLAASLDCLARYAPLAGQIHFQPKLRAPNWDAEPAR